MEGGSSVWKYVGIGCALVGILSMCAVGSCVACGAVGIGGIVAATEAPAETTHAFFRHVREGDLPAAYALTSAAYQASHPQPTFEAEVHAVPGLDTHTDATLSNRAINGTSATMGGILSSPNGPLPITVTLSDVGGTWVIDSVIVSGRPL